MFRQQVAYSADDTDAVRVLQVCMKISWFLALQYRRTRCHAVEIDEYCSLSPLKPRYVQ